MNFVLGTMPAVFLTLCPLVIARAYVDVIWALLCWASEKSSNLHQVTQLQVAESYAINSYI